MQITYSTLLTVTMRFGFPRLNLSVGVLRGLYGRLTVNGNGDRREKKRLPTTQDDNTYESHGRGRGREGKSDIKDKISFLKEYYPVFGGCR